MRHNTETILHPDASDRRARSRHMYTMIASDAPTSWIFGCNGRLDVYKHGKSPERVPHMTDTHAVPNEALAERLVQVLGRENVLRDEMDRAFYSRDLSWRELEVADVVIVPSAVERECTVDAKKPGVASIESAFDSGVIVRELDSEGSAVAEMGADPLVAIRIPGLGDGESAAIALAGRLHAPMLVDERRARAVATGRSIRVIGTLAVLIRARERDRIALLAPILERLSDTGYFVVSESLVAAALRGVRER